MEAAFEKAKKHSELAAACTGAGWKECACPDEVGCREFVGKSTQQLLKILGVNRSKQKNAAWEQAEEAEKGSFCL